MDSFTSNSTYSRVPRRNSERIGRIGRGNDNYDAPDSFGRRIHRSNTESFSTGNSLFSTYTSEKKKRKDSAASDSSYNSSSSCASSGSGPSDEGTGSSHGSSGFPDRCGLSQSEQTLLREIGAALTLSCDDDWESSGHRSEAE